MPVKNGLSVRITAHVASNPGKTAAELGAALGFDHLSGLLSHLKRQGLVHVSGPRHWQRYYGTAELAAQNHEAIAKAAIEQRKAKERECHKRGNRVKKTIRRLKKSGASMAESGRVTLAAPMRDRWAPDAANFVGTFSALGPGRYLDDDRRAA